jgi:cell division protease FtsH
MTPLCAVASGLVAGAVGTLAMDALRFAMVGSWGMSDAIGPVSVLADDAATPWLPGTAPASEHTQKLVDEEVRRLVDAAHTEVTRLLTSERARLDRLAQALLAKETLDEDETYRAAGLTHAPSVADPPAADLACAS